LLLALPDTLNQDSAIYHVPSVKDYYVKLDYILEVISDGPTKSFAFRRLRYLESKFQMYTLLNDYQEMAASKGR
jgi:AMP deaminase